MNTLDKELVKKGSAKAKGARRTTPPHGADPAPESVPPAASAPATASRLDLEIETFCKTIEKAFSHVPKEDALFEIVDPSTNSKTTVSAPAHWSANAVQIMATKYMRRRMVPDKTVVAPSLAANESGVRAQFQRRVAAPDAVMGAERSAEQVFHRLAGTITYWASVPTVPGKAPVLSHDNAPRFYSAMKLALRAQVLAPNSPQWFNTGLFWAYGIEGSGSGHYHIDPVTNAIVQSENGYEFPQTHACFINGVKDDMLGEGGIMDLFLREARIFKMGSGSGANYSMLRGANEPLSGGGFSSGLKSFLRIGDSNAGAIKSGGTTRRAARMVIVNDDHPDVEEIVSWKVEEERKVAALVTGSFANDVHKKAISTAWHAKAPMAGPVAAAQAAGVPGGLVAETLARLKQGIAVPSEVFDTGWQSEAYYTVSGQNANNSIRVSDKLIDAVKANQPWNLFRRVDGAVSKTMPAKQLWRQIAECSWACADPGIQYHDTINAWHTCPRTGPIDGSNPCSEYFFLDDTGCNLASTRFTAYLREDGSFDVAALQAVASMMTVILDTTVTMGQYPSKDIAERTRDFRTLGAGFADIGGLLMRMGIPYDSDRGRAIAASLTSVMTGTGYRTSGLLAETQGAFPGYALNRVPMGNVMMRHYDEHTKLMRRAQQLSSDWETQRPHLQAADRLVAEALQVGFTAWQRVVNDSPEGFRNAQFSCIAPTGTIGLLMDVDTTGIEPEFGISKMKELAGGGFMTIANNCSAAALRSLGYTEAAAAEIEEYIGKHKNVEACAALKPEDRAVFDCAMPGGRGGKRFIAPMGHVQMMAWVQPFVSGGISKTVNMPATCTIEEVEAIHMEAHRLGVKSIAIYRDKSKLSQPLNTEILKDLGVEGEAVLAATAAGDPAATVAALGRLVERKMPARRNGYTQKVDIGEFRFYVTANRFEDGKLGEIFINTSKEGAAFKAIMNAFAIAVSMGLQRGVPLEDYVSAFTFWRFEPAGLVRHHDRLKNATSILDLVFRDLAIEFLGREDLAHVKIESHPSSTDIGSGSNEGHWAPTQLKAVAMAAEQEAVMGATTADDAESAREFGFTGNQCPTCHGFKMKRSGTCEYCTECNNSSGGCA